MATPTLSSPITLTNGVVLPNRLAKAAMAEQMAPKSNLPDEHFKRVYGTWAQGGWGLIMTGNVQVDPAHLGSPQDIYYDPTRTNDAKYLKAWQEWATASTANGTVALVQINHPGRQSPRGAGTKGVFGPPVAPSAIPLNFGSGFWAWLLRNLVFGKPRELRTDEVDEIVEQFVGAAKLAYDSGFSGVEVHGAHGYLLAQFMSSQTNKRTDAFGGSASKRVEIVVRILKAIRKATSPEFIIGLKLNSVDQAHSGDSNEDFVEQLRCITEAGIDYLEVSGGSYESPTMSKGADVPEKSTRTKAREAFFLEFASLIRTNFPKLPLMVTGGFRSLTAMEEAIASNETDMIGLARPSALNGKIPKEVLLNVSAAEKENVKLIVPYRELPWFLKWIPVKAVGAGADSVYYGGELKKLGL